MEVEYCHCMAGMGMTHTHVLDFGPWITDYEPVPGGGRAVRARSRRKAHNQEAGSTMYGVDIPDQIILWVDWKAVARGLCGVAHVSTYSPGHVTV